MNKIITGILLVFPFVGFAQLKPYELHYIQRIDDVGLYIGYSNIEQQPVYRDSITKKFRPKEERLEAMQIHSSVLPVWSVTQEAGYEPSKLSLLKKTDGKSPFRIYPIADLMAGVELGSKNTFLYTAGLGLGIDLSFKKFFMTSKILPYLNQADFVGDSLQRNLNFDAGSNRGIGGIVYYRPDVILAYRPAKFFTFSGGFSKNFFGDGYRSLLLSDNGPANPFLKLETSFGPIKYVNLYQMWFDNSADPFNYNLDKRKYNATHYISWNVTKQFNVSVFESVVWQSQDTLLNRGFDFNYINPIVFYRPVEYSMGSADNVLLGLNSSVRLLNKHKLYFQLVLDEFLLSEIRARSKWWGNKYGVQFGYQTNSFIVPDFYCQLEFNAVRPFTYSHKHSTEVYGNINSSITHPIGANFWEILNILSYEKSNFRFTLKSVFTGVGVDTNATNFGQNIYKSYSLRDEDYNHLMMQGQRRNVLNESLTIQYPLVKAIGLFAEFQYNYRMIWTKERTQNFHGFQIGVRSRIWNRYVD